MKILHAISSVGLDAGGPSRSSQGLVGGLEGCGVEAWLQSFASGDSLSNRGVCHFRAPDPAHKQGVRSIIEGTIKEAAPDLIHVQCIWSLCLHATCQAARFHRIPYVVSPRGMLEPWSLNAKKWKKRVALWLYQRRDLKDAVALHATAESEAEQFKRLGFKQPIIVSPNGVDFPDVIPPRTQREDGKRVILFLSRIHPKKGLVELVEAWARMKRSKGLTCERSQIGRRDWHVEYAGPDSGGHLAEVQKKIRELGVEMDFTYLGNLNDTDKWKAYRRADLFVLPTYSENFGIVIAEALAASVPVLTTIGTPWKALIDNQCGWWIEPGVESLVKGLQEALLTPREQLMLAGERGRMYADKAFSWHSIADQMKSAYEWLLTGGEKPDCVRVL